MIRIVQCLTIARIKPRPPWPGFFIGAAGPVGIWRRHDGYPTMTSAAFGISSIVAATLIWGFSPLYYAAMSHIPPFEVVVHRILWSLPPIVIYALWTGRGPRFIEAGRDRRKLAAMALSTAAISVRRAP